VQSLFVVSKVVFCYMSRLNEQCCHNANNSAANIAVTASCTMPYHHQQGQCSAQCAHHAKALDSADAMPRSACLFPALAFICNVNCTLSDECTASINGFSQKDVHQVQVLSSAVDCISSLQGRMPAATQRLQPQTDLRVCNLAIPEHIV